jgi:hypothetical protein
MLTLLYLVNNYFKSHGFFTIHIFFKPHKHFNFEFNFVPSNSFKYKIIVHAVLKYIVTIIFKFFCWQIWRPMTKGLGRWACLSKPIFCGFILYFVSFLLHFYFILLFIINYFIYSYFILLSILSDKG